MCGIVCKEEERQCTAKSEEIQNTVYVLSCKIEEKCVLTIRAYRDGGEGRIKKKHARSNVFRIIFRANVLLAKIFYSLT